MICGPLGEIYDCITSWPGSTHDSRIWKESLISKKLRSIQAAYPISIHFIPPFKNPLHRRYGRFKNVADSANWASDDEDEHLPSANRDNEGIDKRLNIMNFVWYDP